MVIHVIFIKKIKIVRFHLLPRLPGRRCFFMAEVIRNEKFEQEAKVRCAKFLLDMFQKYGTEIGENNKNMTVDDMQVTKDKEV